MVLVRRCKTCKLQHDTSGQINNMQPYGLVISKISWTMVGMKYQHPPQIGHQHCQHHLQNDSDVSHPGDLSSDEDAETFRRLGPQTKKTQMETLQMVEP